MPQAGMQVSGENTYATKEDADAAGEGRSDTVGKSRGMFDRFLLDQEPPAVEWSDKENGGDRESGDMLTELSKLVGMLTKLLQELQGKKELKEEA
jgi:hypothetical protein